MKYSKYRYDTAFLPLGMEGVKEGYRVIHDLFMDNNEAMYQSFSFETFIIWKDFIKYYETTDRQKIIFDLFNDTYGKIDSIDQIEKVLKEPKRIDVDPCTMIMTESGPESPNILLNV